MAKAISKLSTYRRKRDFTKTAEPRGEPMRAHRERAFVIQQHAARRLHYDFRLELDGVLLSWSVPKGPSLSPTTRRLAVRTEDHPLAYASFEGTIPAGQYGGGTVVVWDRGTWVPIGDAHDGMTTGRLTFELHGEKLHGRWHLVRTRATGKQESWLLFKGRDDAAAATTGGREIVDTAPASVAKLVAHLPVGFPLTSLDKILYPDVGITKAQLIAYLAVVADYMLPHIARRPLALVRCPDGQGQGKPCFYQRHALRGSPAAVRSLDEAMVIDNVDGLVAIAQLGGLEIHTWGCRAEAIEHPDVIVFDLDPDTALAWQQVAHAAIDVAADPWAELATTVQRIDAATWRSLGVKRPATRTAGSHRGRRAAA